MNKLIITGNLADEAKLHTFEAGTSVLNFRVGVSNRVKENGEWIDKSIWFDCKRFFGKDQSTKVAEFLKKGTKVCLSGSVDLRMYEKKDGGQGATLEMKVEEIELQGSKGENGGGGGAAPAAASHGQNLASQVAAGTADDDDLPF